MKTSFKLRSTVCALVLGVLLSQTARAQLAPGVRGLATRAPKGIKIDGDLSPFKNAFCTPIDYFSFESKTLHDRAAQFFYMWDDEAFYAGLRTLDTKPANNADDDHLWEGDAVEWYFDTRQDANFRSTSWPTNASPGVVHCYWTGLKGTNVEPRFCLRPGFLQAIPKTGVEVAARRTKVGMDVEFKMPWVNFPNFKPSANTVIALDAELCYSDGKGRSARFFAYGGPLSVQQPANLSKIQLVDKFDPSYWGTVGQVMFPMRCDVATSQPTRPNVTGFMALPPDQTGQVGKVVFRVLGLDGRTLGDFPGMVQIFEREGNFQRYTAQWPVELARPGAHQLIGIVYGTDGKELTRVAPRMVSTGITPGY